MTTPSDTSRVLGGLGLMIVCGGRAVGGFGGFAEGTRRCRFGLVDFRSGGTGVWEGVVAACGWCVRGGRKSAHMHARCARGVALWLCAEYCAWQIIYRAPLE